MASKDVPRLHAEIQTTLDAASESQGVAKRGVVIPVSISRRTQGLVRRLNQADDAISTLAKLYCVLVTTPEDASNYIETQQGKSIAAVRFRQSWGIKDNPQSPEHTYNPETELRSSNSRLSILTRNSTALFSYLTGQRDYRLPTTVRETLVELRAFAHAFVEWDTHLAGFMKQPLSKAQGDMPFDKWADINFVRWLEIPVETPMDLEQIYSASERNFIRVLDGALVYRRSYYNVTSPYNDLYSCYLRAKSVKRYLGWALNGGTIPSILERLYFGLYRYQPGAPGRTPVFRSDNLEYDGHSTLVKDTNYKLDALLRRAQSMYVGRAPAAE